MNKIFILLNGPPRSGKSTATEMILGAHHDAFEYKMTYPMDMAFKSFFCIPDHEWHQYREVNKDKPQIRFGGHTTREALISFSEGFAKPLAGHDVFGKIALHHMDEYRWRCCSNF
jgi:hypothetical protein